MSTSPPYLRASEPGTSITAFVALAAILRMDVLLLDAEGDVMHASRQVAEVVRGLTTSQRRSLILKRADALCGNGLQVIRMTLGCDEPVELGVFDLDGLTAVIFAGAGYQRLPSTDALRSIYGLTPTEARVAQALASGKSPKQTAHEMDVELSTVRTHLRSVHGKLGAISQSDLVRRLLSSVAVFLPVDERNQRSKELIDYPHF